MANPHGEGAPQPVGAEDKLKPASLPCASSVVGGAAPTETLAMHSFRLPGLHRPAFALKRKASFADECVLGVLVSLATGKAMCATLELPWRDNERDASCLPPGGYGVRPYASRKFGPCFAFDDGETAPRSSIRIHAGNTSADTRGCVLVGRRFGVLGGRPAVLDSREALAALREALREPFWLEIALNVR